MTPTTLTPEQVRVLAQAVAQGRAEAVARQYCADPVQSYWARRKGERRAAMIGAVLGLTGAFWLGVLLSLWR